MCLRTFTRSVQLFLLALISTLGAQQALAAVAIDDVYTAGLMPTIPDPVGECGIGHLLLPHPTQNDEVTDPTNVDLTSFYRSVNPPIVGSGILTQADTDGDQIPDTAIFFPSCGSLNDGTFTETVVFSYDLVDVGDPNNPDVGQITINPAAQQAAATQPDVYDAGNLPSSPGPGTGETTYNLIPFPFANDTLTTQVDINNTMNATDNFVQVSGSGFFRAFIDANGNPVFEYISNTIFSSPVVINYNLRDARGAVIDGTDTTITINPPPLPSITDDTYNADQLTIVSGSVTGEFGYLLAPSPLANDNLFAPYDETATLSDSTNFAVANGAGNVQIFPGPQIAYFPNGTFDTTVTISYFITDFFGTQIDTGTITINPPTPPSTQNDLYDADNPSEILTGTGQNGATYTLLTSPFSNDVINFPADQDVSAFAQGNFQPAPGTPGTMLIVGSEDPDFIYEPGPGGFTQSAIFNYFLVDVNGFPIQGTDATITITPPAQQAPPTTVDDNYDASQLTQIVDPTTGAISYVLAPSPLSNDDLQPPYDESQTLFDTSNFVLVSGSGSIQTVVGQNGPEFRFLPVGVFSTTAVFNYHLVDGNGVVIPNTVSTITIAPPPLPTITDDTYDADTLPIMTDSAAQQFGYLLEPPPFSNDDLQPPFDLNTTINASGNFLASSSVATVNVSPGLSGFPNVVYFPNGPFDAPETITYFISDALGNQLDTGTITITPPTPPSTQNDSYDADNASEVTVVDDQGETVYDLINSPLSNDTINPPVNIFQTLTDQSNFQPAPGTPGVLEFTSIEPLEVRYRPGPGGFSQPAIFNYYLVNMFGQPIQGTDATITIAPPAPQALPVTVDDTYDAEQLTQVIDSASGITGYILSPTPFANDDLQPPYDEQLTISDTANFSLTSGNGNIQIISGQNGPEFRYFPNGVFSSDAVFNYYLIDGNGVPIPNTVSTITITPPPFPTITDDTYDADNLQIVSGSATGQFGYLLEPSPFGNDNLLSPYDENATINASGNFSVSSSFGTVDVVPGQSGLPEVSYFPNGPFETPETITYFISDALGNQLDTGTIVINPPAPSTTQNDVYDADDGDEVVAVIGQGETIYNLIASPLDNDFINFPGDQFETLSAQGNFQPASGTPGSLVIAGSDTPTFEYRPGPGGFSQPAVFNYFLVDVFGQQIQGTDATITITPPAQQAVPTTVDDTYDADQLTQVIDSTSGLTGYVLSPTPFANDDLQPPYDEQQTISDTSNFVLVNGDGNIQISTGQNGPDFTYFPTGTFTTVATFNYHLVDGNGQVIPNTVSTITINPPTIQGNPATVDDVYEADQLTSIIEPEVGIGYILTPTPFANDTLDPPYDEQQTVLDAGNFAVTSGNGRIAITLTANGPEFIFFPEEEFLATKVFDYYLVDGNGQIIPNTQSTISINPPAQGNPAVEDDTYDADQLTQVVDGTSGLIGYLLAPIPFDNDTLDLPYDEQQTINDPNNFVLDAGTGSIQIVSSQTGLEFTYFPETDFTAVAVFTYYLVDDQGAQIDGASGVITINPPSPPPNPRNRLSNVEAACTEDRANNANNLSDFCDNTQITAAERFATLATLGAQADTLFGMQSDQIANIRQRMSESRSVYNPASVAGLNSTIYGKSVPVGKIAQAIMSPISGGGAADDFLDSGRLGFFLNGMFTAGERDDSEFATGYDSDGYNLTSGIDYRVNLNFIIGGALGIAKEDTEFVSNRGEQNASTTTFSFYGNFFPSDSFYADWLFMYTVGDIDITRNVDVLSQTALAETEGSMSSFASTMGYNWNAGSWEFDGYGRLEYTNLLIDGYTESGSFMDLTVDDQEAQSLQAALGTKIAKVFSLSNGVVIPSLDVEWLNQFEDDARFIGVDMENVTNGFLVKNEARDSNYFNAALSLSSVFASGFSGYLRMESQIGDDYLGRARYSGGLRWEF